MTLKDFSFIERPAETLKAIKELARAECSAPTVYLHFDDEYCSDISPYLVLAEVRAQMASVIRGGRMSMPIQKVIAAVGLADPLHMRLKVNSLSDVWAFPLHRRRPSGSSQDANRELAPQPKEVVADEFCDALDEWLGHDEFDMMLTDDGKAEFATIITELLDNAERHSEPISNDGAWSCAAFMARRLEGDTVVYRCHMAFLSVGATVAESLRLAPTQTLTELIKYSSRHARRGQSADTLVTLFALQDGVTRVADAAAEGRGGIGFQEVLRFVAALSDLTAEGRDPRLTIVSGSSCIMLRKPYLEGLRRHGADEPRVIWCNEANSPELPPDPAFVFDLEDRFEGTLVGISFVLDPEYLRSSLDD